MSEQADSVLVRAAKAGDKAALAQLLERHWSLLIALCRQLLGDRAEDAAQEAALRAMLSLDTLQCPERFGAWLGGIGLNVCRLWLRERRQNLWSWESLQGGVVVSEPVDWLAGPEELAEAADLAATVQQAVRDLPRGQREAVLLFYLKGLTYAETAAQLGLRVGTIKAQLHQARQVLRRQLWAVWQERGIAMKEWRPSVAVRVADVRVAHRSEQWKLTTLAAAKVWAEANGDVAAVAKIVAAQDGQQLEETDEFVQTNRLNIASLASLPEAERATPEAYGGPTHVVVFEEVGGTRLLPIWVGSAEGEAIALLLEKVEMPRPLNCQFTANILQASGARLREVRITQLLSNTFYAAAELEGPSGRQTVDSRPSDAVTLALFVGAPIRVEPAVLDSVDAAAQSQIRAFLEDKNGFGASTIAQRVRHHLRATGVAQGPPSGQISK